MAQMPTPISSRSMPELRRMTITCLQQCAGIGDQVSDLLQNEQVPGHMDNENHASSIVKRLKIEIEKVVNFELRMPIIAPMKAGKSTILNAVVGQNLLPTRNAAMTSIPTEIVLNVINLKENKYVEPYLKLDRKFIDRMNQLQDDLRQHFNEKAISTDDMKKKLERHTHLVETAEIIRQKSSKCPTLDTQIYGSERIRLVLIFINDLIRIYECLIRNNAFSDTKDLLDALPRIYAPYIAIGNDEIIHESLGNLVLVDTPGPNEATTSSFLKEIFHSELEKAAIILVVLNFKSLNTEIDDSIATKIQTIRDAKHDDDSLYAIVNQVDERRKGDMTPQQVKEFVARQFKIGHYDSLDQEQHRVFETQALRALLAKQFMYEMKLYETSNRNENFSIEKITCGEDFMTQVYGISWKWNKPKTTCEELHVMAERLWEESGFQSFLHEAIDSLIKKAAPRCLKSALKQCKYNNSQLQDNLKMRKNAMAANTHKLHREIAELENDSKELKQVMDSQRINLETVKKNISHLIQQHFYQAKADGKKDLKQLFDNAQIADEEFERNIQQPVHALTGTVVCIRV
ncbi:unnamed protein product [Rotaria sp. Silwood1]|nr:unnamed protein product [Rotaria sp. Silwood1]